MGLNQMGNFGRWEVAVKLSYENEESINEIVTFKNSLNDKKDWKTMKSEQSFGR